jgi:hypothetical protein
LQRVAIPLAAHVASCDPPQLVVDERHEPVQRRGVALTPSQQKRRGLREFCGDAPILLRWRGGLSIRNR